MSEKLLTDAEAGKYLYDASERYYAGQRDRELPRWLEPTPADGTPADGDVQRNNDYIHYQDGTNAEIRASPIIGGVAARLAQTPSIRVFQATLIYKPPIAEEKSNIVSWHFDKYFWPTCSSDEMLLPSFRSTTAPRNRARSPW